MLVVVCFSRVCIVCLCVYSVCMLSVFVFFFKQKTAYELRISDWSSDVCSSDLRAFYKMIVDRASGAVIGLHLLGPEAPEILQIAAVAMRAGATKQHFDDTMALHPTMAEELVLLR